MGSTDDATPARHEAGRAATDDWPQMTPHLMLMQENGFGEPGVRVGVDAAHGEDWDAYST